MLGECLSGSAGMGFTPHVITVAAGEVRYFDIVLIISVCPSTMCVSIEQYLMRGLTERVPLY